MDSAQITSLVRQVLTALGTALAGTGIAGWFSDSNINIAVIVIGAIFGVVSAIWGVSSNTPAALAQQLIDNPNVNNATAAEAIRTGQPEKLAS